MDSITLRWRHIRKHRALLALVLLASACREIESLREAGRARTPHARYGESLREAGLDQTALGRDWLAAADRALAEPVPATLPFREASYFTPEQATAVAYRISGTRGQRITATVEIDGIEPARVFVDLFEVSGDSTDAPEHLSSADTAGAPLEWEPRRDTDYLLRIQPELLRSGRYTLTVRSEPALAFPVSGRNSRAIQSFFGADRDAGQRQHHGVDIFAPRGTPVIAVAEGLVTRVQVTPRGGKVVWVRDAKRGLSLYYAHLDSQLVASGDRLRLGDTLGLVGNSGNARSTPPHLHFGIYRRGQGPMDPLPWIRESRRTPAVLTADTSRLGAWTRVAASEVPLRAEPTQQAEQIEELPRHTALRVLAATGSWYRVALPDGRSGYVAARSTEKVSSPLRRERLASSAAVRDAPSPRALVIDSIAARTVVPVLARFSGFFLIETPHGRTGWMSVE